MGVDVTCCPVQRPMNGGCHKLYKCFKCNEFVVKYEVGICVKTYEIVWVVGPVPGAIVDRTIYGFHLGNNKKKHLKQNERVWADKGYLGSPKVITAYQITKKHPELTYEEWLFNQLHTAHHFTRIERVNGRLQRWGFLKNKWRHKTNEAGELFHKACFMACVFIHNVELQFNPMNTVDILNP